ncbi:hypothetical protein GGR04_004705 [Aureimonas pseudogalii]|uniref:Uncharacterized protein n=2 Tax=Aureimonas pseudogalii TaxID=1744844 RepID=A0A7W6H8Y9_9HYPH|nr:hypothetical protein [Aureimonas pseudogalii]
MAAESRRIYLFRTELVASGNGTIVCAAPVDLVVATYGGGGRRDDEGVQRAFGGNILYRNDETGECFVGVWGARNASRFRTALRHKAAITIIREPPPARLAWWNAACPRPPSSAQHGLR